MLQLKRLETGYGKKQVLFEIDIEAEAGVITAIIGPNGSGKSTALKASFGLLPVWKGSVFYKGEEITNRSTKANVNAGIGFVPQGNRVFDEMTVFENLEIGGLYLKKEVFRKDIEKIWALFPDLQKMKKKNSGKLSGGEKQMLSIGRALIADPKMLLMDEPSLGLSPNMVKVMMDYIKKINEEMGVTVLIVEQKVREVLDISSKVYAIKLGKIAYEGDPTELKRDNQKLKELFF